MSKEKFFEVDPSFHSMLATKNRTEEKDSLGEVEDTTGKDEPEVAAPFSLLSMFGKAEQSSEKAAGEFVEVQPTAHKYR